MKPVRIAMIGVGAISGIYLKNLTHTFKEVELIGVCDLIPERAETGAAYVRDAIANGAKAVEPKIYKDMYEAFNDPDVEVVLNLTRPYEHYEVTKQALLHGKHVYSEKPLAVDMDEADELVELAEEKGAQVKIAKWPLILTSIVFPFLFTNVISLAILQQGMNRIYACQEQ